MRFKSILVLSISIFILSGCTQDVYQDNRMSNSSVNKLKLEYNMYNSDIIDSGYTWYDNFVYSFLEGIQDNGYKVDKETIDLQIVKIRVKKREVKTLDTNNIKNGIIKIAEESYKKENYKDYKKIVEFKTARVNSNKKEMINILGQLESALKLGYDGEYSKEDLSRISDIQKNIIKLYSEKLKEH